MWSYVGLGEDVVVDRVIVVDVVGVDRGGGGERGATRGNGCVVVVVSGLDGWVGLCGDREGDRGGVKGRADECTGGWVSGCKEGLEQSGNCWWKRCSLGFIWGEGVDGHGGGDCVVVGVEVFVGV